MTTSTITSPVTVAATIATRFDLEEIRPGVYARWGLSVEADAHGITFHEGGSRAVLALIFWFRETADDDGRWALLVKRPDMVARDRAVIDTAMRELAAIQVELRAA